MVIPMLRAVPSIIFTAPSKLTALRSGIFCFEMWCNWVRDIWPTFSLGGTPDPLMMPAAFFKRSEAGGVFVTKEKLRSLYMEMTTGIILPSSFWVRPLNCLQNSIMLTPCWPSDGPTGGAGLAFPAGICNLICATISLAL